MAKDQIYDKRIGCMVPAYPARFTIKYKGLRVEHDGHGALAFAVGPRVADVYDEDVHHSGRPISKNEMVAVAKRIVDAHPKWIAQAKNGDTSQKIFSAGSTRKSPKAKPKTQKVFLKGEAKEKTSRGVSYLVNVVSDAVEINTVARFRSWDDASSSMGGLYGFQSYQGVPMTQEELTTHYPELKRYTGLTKSKIGSAKVWFKNIDMPLVVQYKGYAYMVAPTIEEAKAFRQVPESMTKPKLTAEQRKYLDAHKREDVAGCWQEIEFFQVGIEEAIREAKRLQKQGKRVQIGEFAPTGGRPLYSVMVLMGGSAGRGVAAKPKGRHPADSGHGGSSRTEAEAQDRRTCREAESEEGCCTKAKEQGKERQDHRRDHTHSSTEEAAGGEGQHHDQERRDVRYSEGVNEI
jgi:hypothetical protein